MTLLGSDSDIVDDEDEPVLDTVNVIHDGAVNRLRVRGLHVRTLYICLFGIVSIKVCQKC